MKVRQVFSTPDLPTARAAVSAARAAGIEDEAISLVARSEVEMDEIPEQRLDVTKDTVPASLRGAAAGGAVGVVAGLAAAAFPPVGITVAGAGLIALVGAATGAWSSALFGAGVPNSVRRTFEDEIEAGRILVVVDAPGGRAGEVQRALEQVGAVRLPFEETSATSS